MAHALVVLSLERVTCEQGCACDAPVLLCCTQGESYVPALLSLMDRLEPSFDSILARNALDMVSWASDAPHTWTRETPVAQRFPR